MNSNLNQSFIVALFGYILELFLLVRLAWLDVVEALPRDSAVPLRD